MSKTKKSKHDAYYRYTGLIEPVHILFPNSNETCLTVKRGDTIGVDHRSAAIFEESFDYRNQPVWEKVDSLEPSS